MHEPANIETRIFTSIRPFITAHYNLIKFKMDDLSWGIKPPLHLRSSKAIAIDITQFTLSDNKPIDFYYLY